MPPKFKFTREEITKAALDLTRESGISALTARALAARLNCSVKPVFGLFKNMEEVQREVMNEADKLYGSYLREDMTSGKYPLYKASGMGYIRFAKEERELFKLLFMRDRSGENVTDSREDIKPLLEIIMKNTGLSEDEAYMFHIEMWIYVHGIATMLATSYLEWDADFISKVLTDGYMGLKHRYCNKGEQ
ncbi:MAG: WHG domain-containing protein [Bacteroides sp.]|nr:WHG domain-containing protein [Bacteroides sp.]